jgi:predicted NBD/HSP70 family sugar kinase
MILAVDVGGTYIRTGVIDKKGSLISFKKNRIAEVIKAEEGNQVIHQLADYLQDAMKEPGVLSNIEHICLGVPSIIAKDRDYILNSPNVPALQDIALKSILEKTLGKTVSVENDVNLSTLGEYTVLDHETYRNVIGIFIGTGIGCGLILNGTLFTGATNLAAEFGHLPTRVTGKRLQCNCGLYDCIEVWASGSYFEREMRKAGREDEIPYVFVNHEIDPLKNLIVETFFDYLSFGLYTLNSLLNPNLFIFGGGVVNMEGFPKERLLNLPYGRLRHPSIAESLETKFAILGDKAFIYGALEYYANHS